MYFVKGKQTGIWKIYDNFEKTNSLLYFINGRPKFGMRYNKKPYLYN